MNHNLNTLLDNFSLENDISRQELRQRLSGSVDKSLQFQALQQAPEQFVNIAKAILNGHFCISSAKGTITVHPLCVEIYYHEEQEDGIKDPIVYHRNRKSKTKKEAVIPNVFPLGMLHNHVSGIDITFEKGTHSDNKVVTGTVRASALIREFTVKGDCIRIDEQNNLVILPNGSKINQTEQRSTCLYDVLFGQFSIFDGFTVKWVDGNESYFNQTELLCCGRKNVFEYEKDEYDYHKKDNRCQRMWNFKKKEIL